MLLEEYEVPVTLEDGTSDMMLVRKYQIDTTTMHNDGVRTSTTSLAISLRGSIKSTQISRGVYQTMSGPYIRFTSDDPRAP